MRLAAKYLRVSVVRAMALPSELTDKAFTAAMAQRQALDNEREIEKRKPNG